MVDREFADRALTGGWEQQDLVERGGVVYRRAGPQSPAVLALLRHLEREGFPAAPRVVEPGLHEGRELLTYVDGDVHERGPWDEHALATLGGLLRRLHDATRTFPAGEHRWRDTFARHLPTGGDVVIGHGDLGPWNIVSRDGMPVAFIDWDTAGPVGALWDLAFAAWLNVQLHDDDVAEHQGLGDVAERARHLRVFLDGYGLPRDARPAFVSRIAELAIHEARDEAIKGGVTRSSTEGVLDNGYPILWAVTWRARSASWILTHRDELIAAVC